MAVTPTGEQQHELPEHELPALLGGTPDLPVGQRGFADEATWNLVFLAPSAVGLIDVTVTGYPQGDPADAAPPSSTRLIEPAPAPGEGARPATFVRRTGTVGTSRCS